MFSLAVLLSPPEATAAVVTVQTANISDGGIAPFPNCMRPTFRDFIVAQDFTIDNVKIGLFFTHPLRGELRIWMVAPDGTSIQLVNDDATVTGQNLSVLLDDFAAQTVNAGDPAVDHPTTEPPPYAHTFKPIAPLSGFNGHSSKGAWKIGICDMNNSANSGLFERADLYLSSYPESYVDLSVGYSVTPSSPAFGDKITYTLTVANSAEAISTASAVEVTALLPPGAAFVGSTGDGVYDPFTGIWAVGSLSPASTLSLSITARVEATSRAVITGTAELTATSAPEDLDSTPANGVTTEDDYAVASFTVQDTGTAGTAPTLACPAGTSLLDWDSGAYSWVAGTTDKVLTVAGFGAVSFSLANPGAWYHDFEYGGWSPTVNDAINGGYTGQKALIEDINLADASSVVTATIALPLSIPGAQFRIFDVDYTLGSFADHIVVEGRHEGVTVYPTLTNGLSNYVIGNGAYGNGAASANSAAGTVVVTFDGPIDEIIILYGNHASAPKNPLRQEIALGDLTFCNPDVMLSVTKVSAIKSDPVNSAADPKAIPGAEVEYLVSVANTGTFPTDTGNLIITGGDLPEAKMCFDAAGSGQPIAFTDGTPSSGLSYVYTSLTSASDSLYFSDDGGSTWTYQPLPDEDGCDEEITNFQLRPSGRLDAGGSFALRANYRIK